MGEMVGKDEVFIIRGREEEGEEDDEERYRTYNASPVSAVAIDSEPANGGR
jgi:hypothetical protein